MVLTFLGTSWAEVRDATGTPVLSVTGNAGDVHAVGGRPPFEVVLGSAAAVSVTWLGKAFDTAPFTKQNVAKFTLRPAP
jgi:cytoskeleton protein RodZ